MHHVNGTLFLEYTKTNLSTICWTGLDNSII